MKKIIKNPIFTFILGALIFSGIGVAANAILSSKDVAFTSDNNNWQVGNVEDALNSLYAFKSNTNYSTKEQEVGTWIDGKPIYQKTINFGTLPNNTTKSVSIGVTNIDKIVYVNGISMSSSVVHVIPHVYSSSANEDAIALNKVNGNWQIDILTHTDRTTFTAYITVQYTKTTDQGNT